MDIQATYDVFLCHAPADRPRFTDALFEALSALGKRVRYDRDDVGATNNCQERISSRLRRIPFGIVVFSQSFFESCWSEDQLDALFDLEEQLNTRILPVVLDISLRQKALIEPFLSGRPHFSGLDGEALVAKMLCEAIKGHTAPRRVPRGVFGDIRQPSALFIDPDNHLDALTDLLPKEDVRLVTYVDGASGVGRTELALQVTYRLGEEGSFPGGIYWLEATETSLGPQWARIAQNRGIDVGVLSRRVEVLMNLLSQQSDNVLIVLNSVEEWSEGKKPYPLPEGLHVRFLLTTRKTDVGNGAFAVRRIEPLNGVAGGDLLASSSHRSALREPGKLVECLGGNALALKLSGNYLRRFPDVGVDDYVRLLRKRVGCALQSANSLLANNLIDDVLENIWSVLDAGEREAWLLAACFEDAPATAQLADACKLHAGLRARLMEWGLLQTVGSDRWTMHHRVRAYGRQSGTKEERTRVQGLYYSACARRASNIDSGLAFRLYLPDQPHYESVVRLARQDPEFLGTRGNGWSYLRAVAYIRSSMGQLESARSLIQTALSQANKVLEPNHIEVVVLYDQEAWTLMRLGQLDQAKAVLGHALGLCRKSLDQHRLMLSNLHHSLGTVCSVMGDQEDAKEHYKRAIDLRTQELGKGHPSLTPTQTNLAILLKEIGDLDGARELLEQALESDISTFGENHPKVENVRRGLCDVLQRLGDFDAARKMIEPALEASTQALGENHAHTTGLLAQLGTVLRGMGDLAGAAALFERALQVQVQVYGDGHTAVANLREKLGTVLHDLGDLNAGERHLRLALEAKLRVRGEDDPEVATLVAQLAAILHEQRDLESAHKLLERAIESERRNYGVASPRLANLLRRNGMVLRDLGNFFEARRILGQVAHQLERLEPDFARAWLEVISDRRELEDASELLERMEGHVLAIELVGNYLRRNRDQSTSDLLQLLCQDSAVEKAQGSIEMSEIVERMLDVIWDLLEPELRQACLLAACFSDAPATGALADACGLHVGLRTELSGWGLLRIREDASWIIHSLVRVYARQRLTDEASSELHHQFYDGCAQRAREIDDWLGFRIYQPDQLHYEMVARAINAAPETFPEKHDPAGFLERIAVAQKCAGQPIAARTRMESALDLASKIHGEGHPAVAKYLHGLADILIDLGEYEEAKELLERALDSNLKGLDKDHPDIVKCCGRLGVAWQRLGATERSRTLLTQALERDQRTLGEHHPRVLEWRNQIGWVLRELKDLQGAKRLLTQVLEGMSSQVDSKHPVMIACRSRLGWVLHDLGKDDEARSLIEEALELALSIYGEHHQDVATLRHSLGRYLSELGEKMAGMRVIKQALKSRKEVFGEDHAQLIDVYGDLGTILWVIGDSLEADKLLRQALALALKTHGEYHSQVALLRSRLANVLRGLGDLVEAKQLHERAIASAIPVLSENDPQRARFYLDLIKVLEELGERESIRRHLDEAIRLVRLQPADSENRTQAVNDIVSTLRFFGNLEEAKGILKEALEPAADALGQEHTDVANLHKQLEHVLHDIGSRERARNHFDEVLRDVRLRSNASMSLSMAQDKILMALRPLKEMGDLEEAQQRIERAIESDLYVLGENHPTITILRSSLGVASFGLGDFESARKLIYETVYDLKVLGSQFACLWLEIVSHRRPLSGADNLLEHLDGNALAIEIAGGYLRRYDDLTPTDYLRLLKKGRHAPTESLQGQAEYELVESTLDIVWATLDDEVRQAWLLAACFDESPISAELADACGLSPELRERLEDLNILHVESERRWTMHRSFRTYGRRAGTDSARVQAMNQFLTVCKDQEVLNLEAAHSRLELVSGRLPLVHADRLIAHLKGSGLGIELAGHYLRRYDDLSASDYLRLLRKGAQAPRDQVEESTDQGIVDGVLDTIWTTLQWETRNAWLVAASFEDAPATTELAEACGLTLKLRTQLHDWRIVRNESDGRWSMSRLVRNYGRRAGTESARSRALRQFYRGCAVRAQAMDKKMGSMIYEPDQAHFDAVRRDMRKLPDLYPTFESDFLIKIAWAQFSAGRFESARRLLVQALESARTVCGENDLRTAVVRTHLGHVLLQLRDIAGARTFYEQALATFQHLTKQDPSNSDWQRNLGISQLWIGSIHKERGDLLEAKVSYEQYLATFQRLTKQDPKNSDWQRELGIAHGKVGDIHKERGDLLEAKASYEQALATFQRLTERDPRNSDWQRELGIAHGKVGDIHKECGDLLEAKASYEQALVTFQRLTEQDPSNSDWLRNLGTAHIRVGSIHKERGDLLEAEASYEQYLATFQRLTEQDPSNSDWQRNLGIAYIRVGDLHAEGGDLLEAKVSYEQYLATFQRLTERDPNNSDWQRELGIAHGRVGDIHKERGDMSEAKASYEQALELTRRNFGDEDINVAHVRANLLDVVLVQGDEEAAQEQLSEIVRVASMQPEDSDARVAIRHWLRPISDERDVPEKLVRILQQALPAAALEVERVLPETQAERLSIKRGDLVLSYNGQPVGEVEELIALQDRVDMKEAELEIWRGGRLLRIQAAAGRLGTIMRTRILTAKQLHAISETRSDSKD